jgi:hypothetical protein
MSEPRIFMLGRDGWEESPAYFEHRNGEPVNERWRDRATEVAPGVHVAELSEGGGIGPDGQVASWGARIAVWCEPAGVAAWLRSELEGLVAGNQDLGNALAESGGEQERRDARDRWGRAAAYAHVIELLDAREAKR